MKIWKYKFYRLCVIRLLDRSKLAIYRKMTITSQFADMTSSSNFFDAILFLLSSLVTGSSFMSIPSLALELWQFTFIRDWPEIRNTPIWALPNIWRLGRVKNNKLATDVPNEIFPDDAKFQGYSFYHFWVIKGKLTGGIKLSPPSHTQIRVNTIIIITMQ